MRNWIFILAMVLIGSACTDIGKFQDYGKIENGIWNETDTIQFQVEILDTHSRYDISLMVRHYSDYMYQNLWVNQYVTYPDSTTYENKKSLALSDKYGKWYGVYINDIVSVEVPTEHLVKFKQTGTYTFKYIHLMRNPALDGIMDFGLRIEKSNKYDTERANNSGH